MNTENKLGQEKILKLIFIMAIPAILAQIVNLLYNIVDRMYIGNMSGIGTNALAGLSICTPIITVISAFSAIVSGGGAPLASRALGAKDKDKAFKYLGNGVFLLLLFTIVLTAIAFIFKRDLLYLTGASDETYKYANDYLTIYLCGTLFVQISTGLNLFISGQGKSKVAMLSTLIGAILNIALDPLFIFAFDMGIKGAAIATIIAQAGSAIWVLAILCNPQTSLHIRISDIKPNSKIIFSTISLGIASFVMASTEAVIGFVLNGRLKHYGGDIHVSNLAILQSCMMLITTPVQGFTQGVTPILAYNFGANNKSRLKDTYFKTLIIIFSYCFIMALVMNIAPYPFARMFTRDNDLLNLSKKYLPIFVRGMFIFGIQRACQTTFVAIGESIISLFIAILRKIILLVPFAIIFPRFYGVGGIYYAECIADSIAATICGTIFLFRFSHILKKMPQQELKLDIE